MLLLRLALAALICSIVCLPSPPSHAQPQQPSPPPQQTIRVSVNRVNVGVTVTDSGGHFIEGLRREDFHVFDNGVEQPITDFLSIEEPAQLLLLIESGPAVYLLGSAHRRAADDFLSSIFSADLVAIGTYSKDAQLVLDFTPDKPTAQIALQHLSFKLGFGELNLSSSVAAALDWLAPLPGKKIIILLSTGIDTSPTDNWQIIQIKLKTSDVRILAVPLSGDLRKPPKDKKHSSLDSIDRTSLKLGFRQADQSLRELSESTGGHVYFPKNAREFDRVYAQIAQLVRHEYSLAFAPPSLDGRLHSIEVKVKHSPYRVDHRQAYLAPRPDPQ